MFDFVPEPLTFSAGLAALSLEELGAVGNRLGLNDGLTSKARLLGEIPPRLADRAAVRRFLRELAPPETRALFVAAACEELAPFFGAGVLFRFGPTAPPSALLDRGLLLPDPATGLYRPPAEILPAINEEAAKKLVGPGNAPPAEPFAPAPRSLVRDAVALWCYVLKNPVSLTQSGAAPKRALAKISPLLEVAEDEEPFAALQNLFGASRLEVLVNDVDRRAGFERRENDLYAADWLSERRPAWEDAFGAELAAAVAAEDANAGGLLAAFALALAPAGKWQPLAEVAAAVREVAFAPDEPIKKTAFALFVAGYVAAGLAPDGALVVSRPADFAVAAAPAPEVPAEFLVGANFELKTPYDLPLATRLKLEAFADQVGGGRFLSYAITKGSFYRALDAGITADDALGFLAAHAPRPLPQNVEFSLRDWAAQYGAVAFADTLLLSASSAAVADEIANLPTVAPHVRRRSDIYALEIARPDYEAVRQALVAAGYLPRSLPGRTGVAVSPRALFEGAPPEPTPTPQAAGLSTADMTAAIIAFAVAHRRRLKLWLAGEKEPTTVTPLRIYRHGGEARLSADGADGRVHVQLAAVERAVLA